MKNYFTMVEKHLIRFIVTTLVVIVVVQAMMTRDPLRLYLSWGERMEGQSIAYPVNKAAEPLQPSAGAVAKSPQAQLVIMVDSFSSLPRARILVNNQVRSNFDAKEVTLNLMGGDKVEIDSTAYNFPVTFRVKAVSKNLSYPESGAVYTVNQGIAMIGQIIVK